MGCDTLGRDSWVAAGRQAGACLANGSDTRGYRAKFRPAAGKSEGSTGFKDDVERMDDSWDEPEDRQQDIERQCCTEAGLETDAERRENYRKNDCQDSHS